MRELIATDWKRLHGTAFTHVPVLVTGGAGFIGSHLCEVLLELGASVTVIDDLSGGSRENVDDRRLRFVEASILDQQALRDATDGCRLVFHQAALGSVPGSVQHPRHYNDVNTVGTLNVLEAAREAGSVRRVLFAASSSAYGDNPVPWEESMPVLPRSPYAANKVAGEALLRAYSASYALDSVCLRYFNIFGPRQNANSAYAAVIAAFAKAMIAGRAPVIYGDGEQSRDFTHVHNAVHANLLAARSDKPLQGEVINVGCGGQITVNHLARVMSRIMDKSTLVPEHQPERAGDLRHSYAELTRARQMLEYEPIVSFEDGLAETARWYQQVLVD